MAKPPHKTRYMYKLSSEEPKVEAMRELFRGKRKDYTKHAHAVLSILDHGTYEELQGESRCTACRSYKVADDLPANHERWPCSVAAVRNRCIACIIGGSKCDYTPHSPAGQQSLSKEDQAKSAAAGVETADQPNGLLHESVQSNERQRKEAQRVAETIGTCIKSLQEAQETAATLGDLDSGLDALEHANRFMKLAVTGYKQLARM